MKDLNVDLKYRSLFQDDVVRVWIYIFIRKLDLESRSRQWFIALISQNQEQNRCSWLKKRYQSFYLACAIGFVWENV